MLRALQRAKRVAVRLLSQSQRKARPLASVDYEAPRFRVGAGMAHVGGWLGYPDHLDRELRGCLDSPHGRFKASETVVGKAMTGFTTMLPAQEDDDLLPLLRQLWTFLTWVLIGGLWTLLQPEIGQLLGFAATPAALPVAKAG